MLKCNECNIEFKNYKSLQIHNSKIHKINPAITHVNFYYNGIWPVCGCGCMTKLKYRCGKFPKYCKGHIVRVKGGFYSKEGIKKSAETRRKRFSTGEIVQWNKGKKYTPEQLLIFQTSAKNPERRKKISNAMKGRKKSNEHIAKIKVSQRKYWGDETHRSQQRERRMQYIINNGLGYSSKLEEEFKEILNELEIEYIDQFYVKEIKALYDFKIKGKHILIEVDGDYWHCNPNVEKHKNPTKQWHFDNIKRDSIKNQWASDNGYQLLRFWEDDIKNNRDAVIARLIETCK